jgi:hypothetical protein
MPVTAAIIMITDMTTGMPIAAVMATITIMIMAMNWFIIAVAINKPVRKENIQERGFISFVTASA